MAALQAVIALGMVSGIVGVICVLCVPDTDDAKASTIGGGFARRSYDDDDDDDDDDCGNEPKGEGEGEGNKGKGDNKEVAPGESDKGEGNALDTPSAEVDTCGADALVINLKLQDGVVVVVNKPQGGGMWPFGKGARSDTPAQKTNNCDPPASMKCYSRNTVTLKLTDGEHVKSFITFIETLLRNDVVPNDGIAPGKGPRVVVMSAAIVNTMQSPIYKALVNYSKLAACTVLLRWRLKDEQECGTRSTWNKFTNVWAKGSNLVEADFAGLDGDTKDRELILKLHDTLSELSIVMNGLKGVTSNKDLKAEPLPAVVAGSPSSEVAGTPNKPAEDAAQSPVTSGDGTEQRGAANVNDPSGDHAADAGKRDANDQA
jgi:hypothetical protein